MEQLEIIDNIFNVAWNHRLWWVCRVALTGQSGRNFGIWLQRFHSPIPGHAQEHIAKTVKGIRARLNGIQNKRPDLIDAAMAERIESLQLARLEQDVDASVAVTRIHGDLNLSNIVVLKDKQLSIIDFADAKPGIGLEDVALVYHNLWLLSELNRLQRSRLRAFCQSILDGYGFDPRHSADLLTMHRLQAALIQVMSSIWNPRPSRAVKQMQRANIRWIRELA